MCDPIDDPDLYIRVAQENNLNIRYVIDTHLHADHVSGGRRLAELSGAEYVLHESADTQYAFLRVRDGEVLDLGNVKIQVLHTPGHTPEHISLLVTDKTRGPEPWFLLTGHTLMVGDVGRTELASEPEAGATQLFGTIQRLKEFPESNIWRYCLVHTLARFVAERSAERLFRRLGLSGASTGHSRSMWLNNLSSSCCRVFLPRRQTPLPCVLLTRAGRNDRS